MWDDLWKFDESIAVAESNNHPEVDQRKVPSLPLLKSWDNPAVFPALCNIVFLLYTAVHPVLYLLYIQPQEAHWELLVSFVLLFVLLLPCTLIANTGCCVSHC